MKIVKDDMEPWATQGLCPICHKPAVNLYELAHDHMLGPLGSVSDTFLT